MSYIRNSKQASNNGLVLKKVHRVIKSNQTSWLKSYMNLNIELRQSAKSIFEKTRFQVDENAVQKWRM